MIMQELIDSYFSDQDSPFHGHKLRLCTRTNYAALCRRLSQDLGTLPLSEIKARQLLHWHEQVAGAVHGGIEIGALANPETPRKIAMAHAVIAMLRILVGFGATILEDAECARLSLVLGNMRFKMPKSRNERLTADQVIQLRANCHAMQRRSIALAQAFQFEGMFRQKDIIGEWVPCSEPGISDVLWRDKKWHRGLRWEEIDENLILTHLTSKRQKLVTIDLNLAPMVIQELMLIFGAVARNKMPASGPIIVSEASGLPWHAVEFRRNWRLAADRSDIPRCVKNMDTRAGAISEATDAGAPLENVRHAATHSDIAMTQKYSRNSTEKIADVQRIRVASRREMMA